jgi:geranylgeranyl diphosphate synthase type I
VQTVSDPVRTLRPRLERVLDEHLERQRAMLHDQGLELLQLVDAAADLLAGGKRLRPAFCYWGWRGAGAPDEDAVVAAAASLELFHAAALIHDDLIDDSDTRRGMPSAHRRFARVHEMSGWRGDPARFGQAAALLLGDLCLGWSDELLNSSGLPEAGLRRGRPIFERMRTELIAGQFLDVHEQASGALEPVGQAMRALRVIRYKSAKYSVEHPLVLGGALAGGTERLLVSYSRYGLALGEAFQLRDDILGVFGDPERTGKPAGDDLREGKRTLLVAYALERATPTQVEAVGTLLGNPALSPAGVDAFREILIETGALQRVEALIDTQVATASAALAEAPVAAEAREPLAELIVAATVRTV